MMLTSWAPDSAYVINLSRRGDRLAAFAARTRGLGFPVQRQRALEPTRTPLGWGSSAAAYGCALSHRAILAGTTGTGATLIFEDDALLTPDLGPRLGQAVAALPADWDALLLGAGAVRYTDEPAREGQGPLRQVACFAHTHAYLVSETGRAAALDAIERSVWHWDLQLGRVLGSRGRTFAMTPLVAQDPALGSDIPDSARGALLARTALAHTALADIGGAG